MSSNATSRMTTPLLSEKIEQGELDIINPEVLSQNGEITEEAPTVG